MFYKHTSLQARFAGLPPSTAGLLGGLAPSGFALASRPFRASRSHLACFARANFALTRCSLRSKMFRRKKKCVWIDSKYSETRKHAKKNFYPFDPLARSAKPEQRSTTLPNPCHPQGPKECLCQVSC